MTQKEKTLTKADLAQFTGTESWFRHRLMKAALLYTDGVKHVADAGGAYWLIDAIASCQLLPRVRREEFQSWRLSVDSETSGAVLACEDGDGKAVYTQSIEYTDFPLDELTLYFTNSVLMLPSEY